MSLSISISSFIFASFVIPILLVRGQFTGKWKCAADFLFLLDGSSSVRDHFDQELDVIMSFAEALTIGDDYHRMALIQFSSASKTRVEFEFDRFLSKDKLKAAIRSMPYMTGLTETRKALNMAQEVVANRRTGVPTFVILISDGRSRRDPIEAADRLRKISGIAIYCVGLGVIVDEYELIKIAGDKQRTFQRSNVDELLGQFTSYLTCITTTTSTTTIRTTTSTTTKRPTFPPRRTTSRRTRPTSSPTRAALQLTTSLPPLRILPKNCIMDLFLILDASGSETRSFGREIGLALEVASNLALGPQRAQVALMRFAGPNKQRLDFSFNKYTNETKLAKAIKSTRFIAGSTYLNEALKFAIEKLTPANGQRQNVQQVGILFSDGYTVKEGETRKYAKKLLKKFDEFYVLGVSQGVPYVELLEDISGNVENVFTQQNDADFRRFLTLWNSKTSKCRAI